MWLLAVAHPSKHISGKWPRKYEPHFGLNSLCSHLRCAIFRGSPTEESHPFGRVQFTTNPRHCLLYTFMHPCPSNNIVFKNCFFPGRERALLVCPTMKHFLSHSGWQCNKPLGTPWSKPTPLQWQEGGHLSHTWGDQPEHPAARVQPATRAISFPWLSPQSSWPCRAIHPG